MCLILYNKTKNGDRGSIGKTTNKSKITNILVYEILENTMGSSNTPRLIATKRRNNRFFTLGFVYTTLRLQK